MMTSYQLPTARLVWSLHQQNVSLNWILEKTAPQRIWELNFRNIKPWKTILTRLLTAATHMYVLSHGTYSRTYVCTVVTLIYTPRNESQKKNAFLDASAIIYNTNTALNSCKLSGFLISVSVYTAVDIQPWADNTPSVLYPIREFKHSSRKRWIKQVFRENDGK